MELLATCVSFAQRYRFVALLITLLLLLVFRPVADVITGEPAVGVMLDRATFAAVL
jgi:hypothetical protein